MAKLVHKWRGNRTRRKISSREKKICKHTTCMIYDFSLIRAAKRRGGESSRPKVEQREKYQLVSQSAEGQTADTCLALIPLLCFPALVFSILDIVLSSDPYFI